MIFLTSISPKHVLENRQQETVKTWLKYGEVISFNHPSEIEILKTQGFDSNIQFKETYDTQIGFFDKYYVRVNALTNYVLEKKIDNACMINSDIEFHANTEYLKILKKEMDNSFVYLHRWDYDKKINQSNMYNLGVDAFFFNQKLAATLPQTMYCLGHTYFDIWLPYHFLVNQVPLLSVNSRPIINHKLHPAQYNQAAWRIMGKYTAFLIGRDGLDAAKTSSFIYKHIWANTKYI